MSAKNVRMIILVYKSEILHHRIYRKRSEIETSYASGRDKAGGAISGLMKVAHMLALGSL